MNQHNFSKALIRRKISLYRAQLLCCLLDGALRCLHDGRSRFDMIMNNTLKTFRSAVNVKRYTAIFRVFCNQLNVRIKREREWICCFLNNMQKKLIYFIAQVKFT